MNKIKLSLIGLAVFTLGSCTVAHTALVTNNNVGTKVGVAKATPFQKDADFSFQAAMKNGKITKVGIAETKMKVFVVFPSITMVVTGE